MQQEGDRMEEDPYGSQSSRQHEEEERYISSLCRNGPIPNTRHESTDVACLVMFTLVVATCANLFLLDLNNFSSSSEVQFTDLGFFNRVGYTLKDSLPFTLLACLAIIGTAFLFLILTFFVPKVMGYFTILSCFGLLVFFLYEEIVFRWVKVWKERQQNLEQKTSVEKIKLFTIVLLIATSISIVLLVFLVIQRRNKLKFMGALLGVVKVVIMNNFPLLPFAYLGALCLFSIFSWGGFTILIYMTIQFQFSQTNLPVSPTLVTIIVVFAWFWVHGIIIALADYLCQSWVIHWYFLSERGEVEGELSSGWRRNMIYKLFRFHLGTIIKGCIQVYIPQLLIRYLKRKNKQRSLQNRKKPSAFLQFLSKLSRYCYIETTLECLDFNQAQTELFKLRKRIKTKLPQIYMLGHFFDDVMKILLIMGGVYFLFFMSFRQQIIQSKILQDLTPGVFTLTGIITAFGIFLQISTIVSHLFGMLSDTAVITFCIDSEIQRVHYHQNQPYSLPEDLKEVIQSLQIGIKWNPGSTREQQFNRPQSYRPWDQPMYESQYLN